MAKVQVPGLFDNNLEHGTAAKALKAAGAAGTSIPVKTAMVPMDQIHVVKGLNPRVWGTPSVKAHVEEVGKSILENGFYPDKALAVFVRKIDGVDTICLRDGHHRFAGAEWANKKKPGSVAELPVIFDAEEMSNADMIVSFATGNMGKPLTPYEMGVVVQRLAAEGLVKKEICRRLTITDRYLEDLGHLMESPQDLLDLVVEDRISATLAIEMIKTHGHKAATSKLLKAANKEAPSAKGKAPAKKQRVTSKHLAPEDRPKSKKSAGGGSTATAPDTTTKEPGDVFVRDLRMDAALDALKIMNTAAQAFLAVEKADCQPLHDAMIATIVHFGDGALLDYAIDEHVNRYEEAGMVYLGLVTPPEPETPEPAPEPAAAKPKRDRSKKVKTPPADPAPEPVTEAEKAHIEEAAADL